jgi:hypothetical protein
MEEPVELAHYAQGITLEMDALLDAPFDEKLLIALEISRIPICSIRVRRTTPTVENYHAVMKFFEFHPTKQPSRENPPTQLPFFTVTFAEQVQDEMFDVTLGFCPWTASFLSYQPEACYECEDEEFCSQQVAELDLEKFGFNFHSMETVFNVFTGKWTPVLADFAYSFGVENMYEVTPFVLDQVSDSWSEISKELIPNFESYEYDRSTGRIKKDSDLCLKEECDDYADSRGLCTYHEDSCRVPDCWNDRDEGAYCYSHAPN